MSILFTPISIIVGIIGGKLAQKLVMALWTRTSEAEPPQPSHRHVSWAKLAVALAVEGVVMRLVRGLLDHGTRHVWLRLTGAWPGEQDAEAA